MYKDVVEKEVAYLAKNFRKFFKMKNSGKSFGKGKSSSFKNNKKYFKKNNVKESSTSQGIVCYECNGHGHLKRECPNYLKGKGKVLTTTLSDSESSSSDSKKLSITLVDTKGELDELNEELGEHTDVEKVEATNDE